MARSLTALLSVPLLLATSCALPDGMYDPAETELANFQAVQATQERYVWCWAACAEMALRYHETPTTQAEIVERIHGYDAEGELKVQTATRYELYRALSPGTETIGFEELWSGIRDQLTAELDALKTSAQGALEGGEAVDEVDAPSKLEFTFDDSVLVNDAIDRIAPSRAVPIDALIAGEPVVAGLRDDPTSETGHLYVVVGANYLAPNKFAEAVPAIGKGLTKTFEASFAGRADGGMLSEASMARAENLAARFGESKYRIETLELVDPFSADDPTTERDEMRITMTFDEFVGRVDFVTTQADAHAILTRWTELAKLEVE